MPNWCSNSITIWGPYDKLKHLLEDAKRYEPGLLEAMVPIGEWDYGKASEAWGTKWDVSVEDLELTDNGDGTGTIEGHFDSAWGPPTDALKTYCDNNDDVEIECFYFEPGQCFVGCWTEGDDDYHVYSDAIPTSAIQQNFDQKGLTYFKGIDVKNGGFTQKGEYLMKDMSQQDMPEIFFNEIITNGFERNGLVSANLINLEFLFDDSNAVNYDIYRYFGLYINESPEGEFVIDTVTKGDLISIQPNSTKFYSNTDTFTDEDFLPSVDDLKLPTLNYVKSGAGEYFHIKNNSNFKSLRLPLSIDDNKSILNNFKKDDIVKFEASKESVGFIKLNVVKAPQDNDRFYIADLTELKIAQYDLADFTYIADSSIAAGSFKGNRFSNQGTLPQIAQAISDAISFYDTKVNGSNILIRDYVIGDAKGMSLGIYSNNLIDFLEVVTGSQNNLNLLSVVIPTGVSTDFNDWLLFTEMGGSVKGASILVDAQELGKLQVGDYVKEKDTNEYIQITSIVPNELDQSLNGGWPIKHLS